jgi:hypothetical protein
MGSFMPQAKPLSIIERVLNQSPNGQKWMLGSISPSTSACGSRTRNDRMNNTYYLANPVNAIHAGNLIVCLLIFGIWVLFQKSLDELSLRSIVIDARYRRPASRTSRAVFKVLKNTSTLNTVS